MQSVRETCLQYGRQFVREFVLSSLMLSTTDFNLLIGLFLYSHESCNIRDTLGHY